MSSENEVSQPSPSGQPGPTLRLLASVLTQWKPECWKEEPFRLFKRSRSSPPSTRNLTSTPHLQSSNSQPTPPLLELNSFTTESRDLLSSDQLTCEQLTTPQLPTPELPASESDKESDNEFVTSYFQQAQGDDLKQFLNDLRTAVDQVSISQHWDGANTPSQMPDYSLAPDRHSHRIHKPRSQSSITPKDYGSFTRDHLFRNLEGSSSSRGEISKVLLAAVAPFMSESAVLQSASFTAAERFSKLDSFRSQPQRMISWRSDIKLKGNEETPVSSTPQQLPTPGTKQLPTSPDISAPTSPDNTSVDYSENAGTNDRPRLPSRTFHSAFSSFNQGSGLACMSTQEDSQVENQLPTLLGRTDSKHVENQCVATSSEISQFHSTTNSFDSRPNSRPNSRISKDVVVNISTSLNQVPSNRFFSAPPSPLSRGRRLSNKSRAHLHRGRSSPVKSSRGCDNPVVKTPSTISRLHSISMATKQQWCSLSSSPIGVMLCGVSLAFLLVLPDLAIAVIPPIVDAAVLIFLIASILVVAVFVGGRILFHQTTSQTVRLVSSVSLLLLSVCGICDALALIGIIKYQRLVSLLFRGLVVSHTSRYVTTDFNFKPINSDKFSNRIFAADGLPTTRASQTRPKIPTTQEVSPIDSHCTFLGYCMCSLACMLFLIGAIYASYGLDNQLLKRQLDNIDSHAGDFRAYELAVIESMATIRSQMKSEFVTLRLPHRLSPSALAASDMPQLFKSALAAPSVTSPLGVSLAKLLASTPRSSDLFTVRSGSVVAQFSAANGNQLIARQLLFCSIACVLIVWVFWLFVFDSLRIHVVEPGASMNNLITNIRQNPLKATQLEELLLWKQLIHHLLRKTSSPSRWSRLWRCVSSRLNAEAHAEAHHSNSCFDQLKDVCRLPFSTRLDLGGSSSMLEQTLSRIGSLVLLGFGEAGAPIIAESLSSLSSPDPHSVPFMNLSESDNAGRCVRAVFAFCDIRNFAEITEALQGEVLQFINQVADTVHHITDEFRGATNKNIGDAFLLVWKVPEDSSSMDESLLTLSRRSKSVCCSKIETEETGVSFLERRTADLACAAAIKILTRIRTSPILSRYSTDARIRRRFGPDFRVQLGLGLHFGTAIEGAIGSDLKVDASYLGADVNLASRLESATKQLGVPLLMSEQFVQLLSMELQSEMRWVDRVMLKGMDKPTDVFSFDMDLDCLTALESPPKAIVTDPSMRVMEQLVRRRQRRLNRKRLLDSTINIPLSIEMDPIIQKCRAHITPEFLDCHWNAMEAFRQGDWELCHCILDKQVSLFPFEVNGPSSVLLAYMDAENDSPPEGWKGYRRLTVK